MKKILPIALTASMLLSLVPSMALAYKGTEDTKITLIQNTDGTWSKIPNERKTYGLNDATIEAEICKDYDHVYLSEEQEYFQQITTDTYVEVEPVTANLNSKEDVENLQQYEIPQEMYHDILDIQSRIEDTEGNENAEVLIFVNASENTNSRLKEPNTMPDKHTRWNGMNFVNRVCYFTDMRSGTNKIDKGISWSEATARTATELYFFTNGASKAAKAIDIFESFNNIVGWWRSAAGNVTIVSNAENYFEINLTYNMALQYTYLVMPNKEYLGCASQRIRITHSDGEAFFFDGARGYKKPFDYDRDEEYASANYNNPEPKASQHYLGTYTETIKGELDLKDEYGKELSASLNIHVPNFKWPSKWPEN